MSELAHPLTHSPAEVVRLAPVSQAQNGICYASMGQLTVPSLELDRMVNAVPNAIARGLNRKAYYSFLLPWARETIPWSRTATMWP